jgi:phospholipase/carboxylesterase
MMQNTRMSAMLLLVPLIFTRCRLGYLLILFVGIMPLVACLPKSPEVPSLQARPVTPQFLIEPGVHDLGLGGRHLINQSTVWRDGFIYIPKVMTTGKPLPLLVWLHGGGGNAVDIKHALPLAEELGVVVLALDSRHNTWDAIDSPYGPDVLFIDKALRYIFQRVNIDTQKIGLGGLSDGATYALAVGRSNGDLFTHLIAVAAAPWFLASPSALIGKPRILIAHGLKDNVYNVRGSRWAVVPALKRDGYDVTYFEFDGPHWVPMTVASKILCWLAR